jgi:hypothetical protein
MRAHFPKVQTTVDGAPVDGRIMSSAGHDLGNRFVYSAPAMLGTDFRLISAF